MKVSVVILNWNRKKDTIACVKSILGCRQSTFELQMVIVDNGSTDDSVVDLKKIDTKGVTYEVVPTGKNLGYTGGNNIGIRHAQNHGADYILVLNNDTIVHEDLIEELLAAAKRHTRGGVFTPKIYFAKGYEFHKKYKASELGKVIWSVGGNIDFDNMYGENIGVNEVDREQYNKEVVVDFATGAAIFIKAKVVEKVGIFDDKYFMYMEDVDFCMKVKRLGFQIIYVPKAIVWHKVAQSSNIGDDLNDYYIHRNRLLFGSKYASLRTKIALFRESLRFLLRGRKWQRQGVLDFYLFRFGRGSWR